MDDLHILGASHWDTNAPVNIAIADGVIRAVSSAPFGDDARETLNAAGYLASPAFVEPHYHLDKVLVTEGSRPGATFEEQIAAVALSKSSYTESGVSDRAEQVARILAQRGVCCVRTFADVDSYAGLVALRALLGLRLRLRDIIDIQIVAFPQHGLYADPRALDLVREAIALGADLVGGHPQLEQDTSAGLRQIETLFDLAAEHDVDLDFHVDETDRPDSRWLDAVIATALDRGWRGRVCVSHCISLAKRTLEERNALYGKLRETGVTVVSSPTSGLLFRGHGDIDPTRGIVPVRELLESGVPVACAQEVYRSVFAPNLRYPDPLLTAQIMAYVAKLSDDHGLREVWKMITHNPAAALRLQGYGLAPGCTANLILLRAPSLEEVFGRLTADRMVFRRGRLLAASTFSEALFA